MSHCRAVQPGSLRCRPGKSAPISIVILTSAYSRESVKASFAGLRIEHFIRKPFQFADLMGMLQDALSARCKCYQGSISRSWSTQPG